MHVGHKTAPDTGVALTTKRRPIQNPQLGGLFAATHYKSNNQKYPSSGPFMSSATSPIGARNPLRGAPVTLQTTAPGILPQVDLYLLNDYRAMPSLVTQLGQAGAIPKPGGIHG